MQAPSSIERSYTVRNSDADFLQELKPSSLLSFFQEAAGDHANKMGLGFGLLSEKGCFWVLSKIHAEVAAKPRCGERVTVVTWPHRPNKAIYERSFAVKNEAGEVLIRAYSRWCILQKDGRIVPCSRLEQPQIDFIEERAVCVKDWSVPAVEERVSPAFSLRVANSEYDLNRHVNNIKYADYLFNCFSVQELEERRLRSFQLHYVRQSHEGDLLEFYRRELSPGVFAVEGVKNGAETVVAGQVCFDRV